MNHVSNFGEMGVVLPRQANSISLSNDRVDLLNIVTFINEKTDVADFNDVLPSFFALGEYKVHIHLLKYTNFMTRFALMDRMRCNVQ